MAAHHAAGLRPWYRLHASTWVVVAAVTCGVVFVEIPAEVTVHYIHYADRYTEYKHGWPWVYLEHSTGYDFSDPLNSIEADAIPWLHAVCWNVAAPHKPESTRYRPRYIAPDVLVGLLLICVAGFLAEWRRRRRRVWQFSLGELLIGVLLSAAALGWWRYRQDGRKKLFEDARMPESRSPLGIRDTTTSISFDFGYAGPAWLARLVGKGPLEAFNAPVAAFILGNDPVPAIRELSKRKRMTVYLRQISVSHFYFEGEVRLADLDEESIRVLTQLPSVQTISIYACRLDDRALHRLAEMPNLRKLDLDRCGGMTEAGIACLRASRHIEVLQLRETPFRAEP
ncbi:MAG TPA: hypothetical protein VHC22_10050 [Pirellulales bacterium]|nr:hypothetical protein [Pirellulales bacterium]